MFCLTTVVVTNRVWTLSLCAHYFSVGKAKDRLYLRAGPQLKCRARRVKANKEKKRGGGRRELHARLVTIIVVTLLHHKGYRSLVPQRAQNSTELCDNVIPQWVQHILEYIPRN